MRECGKILQSRTCHRRQYGACALCVVYLRLQTRTQNMSYFLLFHCNNVCPNAPQRYVIVLFISAKVKHSLLVRYFLIRKITSVVR